MITLTSRPILLFLSSWPGKIFFSQLGTYFDLGNLGSLGKLLVVLSLCDARIVRRCNDGFCRFYGLGRVVF